jgi:NAD+ kinase
MFRCDQNTPFYVVRDAYNLARSQWIFDAIDRNLKVTDDYSQAKAVIVIGGDGSLLNAVRKHNPSHLPVLALNGGTLGKNLVDVKKETIDAFLQDIVLTSQCELMALPMLSVAVTDIENINHQFYVFNDVWADRLDAVSVRYQLTVIDPSFDEDIPITEEYVSGDGILASTPIGSTGYARMLGEMVLPLHKTTIMVAPIASMMVSNKRKVHALALDEHQSLLVNFIDTDFRKARLAIDGEYIKKAHDYLVPKKMVISVANSPKRVVTLILPSRVDFLKKQMSYVAR